MQSSRSLQGLPPELRLKVLSNLGPEDIMSLASASRLLNNVTHDESLWEVKFKKHFPKQINNKKETTSWYGLFKTTYTAEYAGLSTTQRRLFSAVKENDVISIKQFHSQGLLTEDNLSKETPSQGTIIHIAVQHGCCEVLTVLAQWHVDLNRPNRFGERPIHSTAYDGQVEALAKLHEWGADPVGSPHFSIISRSNVRL